MVNYVSLYTYFVSSSGWNRHSTSSTYRYYQAIVKPYLLEYILGLV
jgi:hypothetical protein